MPPFLSAFLEVLIGIALLFGGGEFFVQGAVTLSLIFGIPQLVPSRLQFGEWPRQDE